jgi:hypothetical protein
MQKRSIGGIWVQFHPFLTSELDGCKCSALGPGCLTAVNTALEVMWAMNLAVFKKKKISCPAGNRTLDHPAHRLVAISTTLSLLISNHAMSNITKLCQIIPY